MTEFIFLQRDALMNQKTKKPPHPKPQTKVYFRESVFRLLIISGSLNLGAKLNCSPRTGRYLWPQAFLEDRYWLLGWSGALGLVSSETTFFGILGQGSHHQALAHCGQESSPHLLVALSHCTARNTVTTEWERRAGRRYFGQSSCWDIDLGGER